jgi:hypothetical protein
LRLEEELREDLMPDPVIPKDSQFNLPVELSWTGAQLDYVEITEIDGSVFRKTLIWSGGSPNVLTNVSAWVKQ